MNEIKLGCQLVAGQRPLPQSFQNSGAGMEARAGQPILRALAPQQDEVELPLLDRPAIPVHETRSPGQPGLECVAAAPRFSPPKNELEPECPSPRWLAELCSELNKDVIQTAAHEARAPSQHRPDNFAAAPPKAEPEPASPPRWLAGGTVH